MPLLDIILSETLPSNEIIDCVWSAMIDDYRQSLFEDSNHPLAFITDCSSEKYTPQVVNKSASGIENKSAFVLCELCGNSFREERYLKRHVQRVHGEELTCNFCYKTFGLQNQLDRHLMEFHDVPLKCRECLMNFSSKKLLDAHFSLNHGDGVINYCNECERLFSSVTSLRRHDRVVHQKVRPHVCAHCNKAFGQSSSLKIHLQRMHPGADSA
ncbi:Zinc finger protein OZF [Echinococcus granulosus]|nr:Zinc finger protein OZF [Echinococcus granulosus]